MRTLLIDADPYAYKYASRNETSVDWDGDGECTITTDLDTARDELTTDLAELVETLKADNLILALTDYEGVNFRKAIFPGYKSKRGVKPKLLHELRAFMQERWTVYIRPTLEADDVLGILATHRMLLKGEKVIVSIDKDLRTVPGLHHNPDKDRIGAVTEVSKLDGFRFFMSQVITGDPTDNYPGCPGAGPKAAERALSDLSSPSDLWTAVVDVYARKELTEEDALIQARCARILQSKDYDFKLKRPILWTPPK